MNTCSDVSNHLNLIDNWLSNDKTTFFNFLNNKKQNKFIHHFLKATRNESNSTNDNINSSINKDNHRNQTLSNSEQISTSQKPAVHLTRYLHNANNAASGYGCLHSFLAPDMGTLSAETHGACV